MERAKVRGLARSKRRARSVAELDRSERSRGTQPKREQRRRARRQKLPTSNYNSAPEASEPRLGGWVGCERGEVGATACESRRGDPRPTSEQLSRSISFKKKARPKPRKRTREEPEQKPPNPKNNDGRQPNDRNGQPTDQPTERQPGKTRTTPPLPGRRKRKGTADSARPHSQNQRQNKKQNGTKKQQPRDKTPNDTTHTLTPLSFFLSLKTVTPRHRAVGTNK